MTILHLTIKKKWFDMIASGEKKEEYRAIKKYWINRLTWHEYHNYPELELMAAMRSGQCFRKDFDAVEFKNGYGKNVPSVTVVFKGMHWGFPSFNWIDGITSEWFFCIELGNILSITR